MTWEGNRGEEGEEEEARREVEEMTWERGKGEGRDIEEARKVDEVTGGGREVRRERKRRRGGRWMK